MGPEEIIEKLRNSNAKSGDLVLLVCPEKGEEIPLILGKLEGLKFQREFRNVWMDIPYEKKGHFGFFDHPIYHWTLRRECILPHIDKNGKSSGRTISFQNHLCEVMKSNDILKEIKYPEQSYPSYTMRLNYGIEQVFLREQEIAQELSRDLKIDIEESENLLKSFMRLSEDKSLVLT
jgi:hypothetical protein